MREKLFITLLIFLAIINTLCYYIEKAYLTVKDFHSKLVIKFKLNNKNEKL